MLKAGTLKRWLQTIPDDVEVCVLDTNNYALHAKHVHLCSYKDGSGERMIVFTPMGSHLRDEDFIIHSGAAY